MALPAELRALIIALLPLATTERAPAMLTTAVLTNKLAGRATSGITTNLRPSAAALKLCTMLGEVGYHSQLFASAYYNILNLLHIRARQTVRDDALLIDLLARDFHSDTKYDLAFFLALKYQDTTAAYWLHCRGWDKFGLLLTLLTDGQIEIAYLHKFFQHVNQKGVKSSNARLQGFCDAFGAETFGVAKSPNYEEAIGYYLGHYQNLWRFRELASYGYFPMLFAMLNINVPGRSEYSDAYAGNYLAYQVFNGSPMVPIISPALTANTLQMRAPAMREKVLAHLTSYPEQRQAWQPYLRQLQFFSNPAQADVSGVDPRFLLLFGRREALVAVANNISEKDVLLLLGSRDLNLVAEAIAQTAEPIFGINALLAGAYRMQPAVFSFQPQSDFYMSHLEDFANVTQVTRLDDVRNLTALRREVVTSRNSFLLQYLVEETDGRGSYRAGVFHIPYANYTLALAEDVAYVVETWRQLGYVVGLHPALNTNYLNYLAAVTKLLT